MPYYDVIINVEADDREDAMAMVERALQGTGFEVTDCQEADE